MTRNMRGLGNHGGAVARKLKHKEQGSMGSLLIDCRPLMVLPPLMVLFKGNYTKALIVQQIHFVAQQKRGGILHDGHKWIWFTYEEWCEDTFTWLSPGTLGNTMRALEAEGYIISTTRIKDKWDNTKYYRLNYSMLECDPGVIVEVNEVVDIEANTDVTPEPNVDVGFDANVDVGFLYTETSSKTSTKKQEDDDDNARVRADGAVFKAWQENIPGTMTPILAEKLHALVDECGGAAVIHGIVASVEAGARNFSYIAKCARNHAAGVEPARQENAPRYRNKREKPTYPERKTGYSQYNSNYAYAVAGQEG